MSDLLPNGIHLNVPESVYRADPGLNQSLLKKFGEARTPAHYKAWLEEEKEEPDYIRVGRMVDCMLFTPLEFGQRFALWDTRRQGNDWDAFRLCNKDKTIHSVMDLIDATKITQNLLFHEDVPRLHDATSYQVVVIATHPVHGYRMKCLLDMLPDESRCDESLLRWAFDLKVCNTFHSFTSLSAKFQYEVQAQWYMDCLRYNNRMVDRFGFIAAESAPPYAVDVHYLEYEQEEIIRAREKSERWALQYLECQRTGVWPSYTSGWKKIQYKPHQLREEQEPQEME